MGAVKMAWQVFLTGDGWLGENYILVTFLVYTFIAGMTMHVKMHLK
jgi:hypothetical protein